MEIPTLSKRFVKNAGYIGAIIIFVMIASITAAVMIPKLVKPPGEIPSAKLEAKVDYLERVHPGDNWYANVTVFENARITAHNIKVTMRSNLFGKLEKSEILLMPFEKEVFEFAYTIPDNVVPGSYPVFLTIDADEAVPSNYTFTVYVSSPLNETNQAGNQANNQTQDQSSANV